MQFCPFPPDPFALGRAPPLLFLFPLAVCLQTSAADIQHRRHDMFAGAGIVFMGKTVTLMADKTIPAENQFTPIQLAPLHTACEQRKMPVP